MDGEAETEAASEAPSPSPPPEPIPRRGKFRWRSLPPPPMGFLWSLFGAIDLASITGLDALLDAATGKGGISIGTGGENVTICCFTVRSIRAGDGGQLPGLG